MNTTHEAFWRNRRVLVTGHTGFKGAWLCYWLHSQGAQVTGYALHPATQPSLFDLLCLSELVDSHIAPLSDTDQLQNVLITAKPEFVFHLAAQAQIWPALEQPFATFQTNIMGCAAVLEAVRKCSSVRVCQIVTSDKCYAQPGLGRAFSEGDSLGGDDPYSASKAAAELVTNAYRASYFSVEGACSVASVRAGNALGGGDWAEHRIFPNSVRALRADKPIALTHPDAIRPWQYVLEPLSGYLWLAQQQYFRPRQFAQSWNFGPEADSAVPLRLLAEHIVAAWGDGTWLVQRLMQDVPDAPTLTISIEKACQQLAWKPSFDLRQTVAESVRVYRSLYEAMTDEANPIERARAVCSSALNAYTAAARAKSIAWAMPATDGAG